MDSLKIYLGVAGMAAFGILYFMYSSAKAENELLQTQLTSAYERHERDREKIKEIVKVSEDNQKLYLEAKQDSEMNLTMLSTLQSQISVYKEQNNVLVKLFSDHDFARLFKAKPNLVIKRMRSGTDRVFKQLEEASSRDTDSLQNEEGSG